MEIGIHTFASANFKDEKGNQIPGNQAINELLDRIEYADKIGIDEVGIGEHHRKEFLDSAAHITLSADIGLSGVAAFLAGSANKAFSTSSASAGLAK